MLSLQTVYFYYICSQKFVSSKSYTTQSRCSFCKPHRNRLNPVKLAFVNRVLEAFAASAFIAAIAVEFSGGIWISKLLTLVATTINEKLKIIQNICEKVITIWRLISCLLWSFHQLLRLIIMKTAFINFVALWGRSKPPRLIK